MNECEKFIIEVERQKLNECLRLIYEIKILLLNYIPHSISEVELKAKILDKIYDSFSH